MRVRDGDAFSPTTCFDWEHQQIEATTVQMTCKFHPVGQGIFSSGSLNHEGKQFRWVYDCGTTSKQVYLTKQINEELCRFGPGRQVLDLAILSHFDKDHLSGFVNLLTSTKVKVLALPFIPLAYRLILAIESGASPNSDVFQFLLDPAGFFSNPERFQVEVILLVLGRNVPPNDDEVYGPTGDRPDPDDNPNRRNSQETTRARLDQEVSLTIQYEVANLDELGPDEQPEFQHFQEKFLGNEVAFLRPNCGLTVERIWEFFPYNDFVPSKRISSEFIADVEKHRDALLNSPSDASLHALKDLYDQHFGKTGKMRNVISLFLYAGTPSRRADYFNQDICVQYHGFSPSAVRKTAHLHLVDSGILYTGDGYLKTGEQIVRFASAMGTDRLSRKNFLQVMHHGAKSNSHPSIARFLSPLASIYCSDPQNKRYKHPHEPVKKQFSKYSPLQVDLINYAEIHFDISC